MNAYGKVAIATLGFLAICAALAGVAQGPAPATAQTAVSWPAPLPAADEAPVYEYASDLPLPLAVAPRASDAAHFEYH